MKILRLTLKKKWFEMIKSGEKTEEYREIKPYWEQRFAPSYMESFPDRPQSSIYQSMVIYRVTQQYNCIEFVNGYSPNSPRFKIECNGIVVGEGKPQWGAEPGKQYFIIKLGKILNAGAQKGTTNG